MLRKIIGWWTGAYVQSEWGVGMTKFGRLCWSLMMFDALRDGNSVSYRFRWWNPLCWLLWIVMLPICGIVGEPVREVVPFRLTAYWSEHKDQIRWISGWPDSEEEFIDNSKS